MSSHPIAILRDGETTYRAVTQKDRFTIQSAPHLLIQAIYDLHPKDARRIVRHRIYTSAPWSVSIQGMVKVAAKRITTDLAPDAPELIPSTSQIVDITPEMIQRPQAPRVERPPGTLPPGSATDHHWMALALELAHPSSIRTNRSQPRYECDRPIAALLVSSDGKLLGSAINTNGRNRTLHAEMNLLLDYLDREKAPLPVGATIYTTLKPCKMCAGAILDSAKEIQSLRVLYAENDPGRNAQHTALDLCPHRVQAQTGPLMWGMS